MQEMEERDKKLGLNGENLNMTSASNLINNSASHSQSLD